MNKLFKKNVNSNILFILVLFILIDGFFHFFSSMDIIKKMAPDWVISRYLFNKKGLDKASHRAIGLFLIISSLYVLLSLMENRTDNFVYYYQRIVIPLVLGIIGFGIIIHLINKFKNN